MEKWEYKIEINLNEYTLNTLGELGWELITVTSGISIDFFYLKKRLL